ncbi:MAG: dihydropteroate synthase [Desulfuromonadales bacterium]|nr:dihydropteroate synthase [Desulfuromonadales bacterium]
MIWYTAKNRFDLSDRPYIMGILNLTPDSFSEGGSLKSVDETLKHAERMVIEGADIIDIGGESTRPGANPVSADEELKRIMPALERVIKELAIPVSVDTWKSKTAYEALASGAEIINDISGLTFDPALASVIADANAGVVLMHTRGTPAEMQNNTDYSDIIDEISSSLAKSVGLAEKSGITSEQIVLDPGLGFGKSVSGNVEIIKRLHELKKFNRPLLIGSSRKSFIGHILKRNPDERLFGTAATLAVSMVNGASIFRVHDVKAMRDVVDMTAALIDYGSEGES